MVTNYQRWTAPYLADSTSQKGAFEIVEFIVVGFFLVIVIWVLSIWMSNIFKFIRTETKTALWAFVIGSGVATLIAAIFIPKFPIALLVGLAVGVALVLILGASD